MTASTTSMEMKVSSPSNWNALPSIEADGASSLPPLPEHVVDRNGRRINLTGPMWRTDTGTDRVIYPVFRLNRPAERGEEGREHRAHKAIGERGRGSMLADPLAHAMKLYLSYRLTKFAPRTVRADLSGFLHFERYCFDELRFHRGGKPIQPHDLSPSLLDVYRSRCEETLNTKGHYPYMVAQFYGWCRRRGYPGFSRKVDMRLKAIRFEGSLKGHIARMQCPRRGALEFEERMQIEEAIQAGVGDPIARAVVFLLQQLGIRPQAAVLLRRRHLEAPQHPGEAWWLHVPRVKQRRAVGTEILWKRRISSRLGHTLRDLPVQPGDDPPLLPLQNDNKKQQLRTLLRQWANDADLITDRLAPGEGGWRSRRNPGRLDNARLPLTPYRFRRTIALMLANQGADAGTIAAALDDKTLGMASVYAQSSSTMVDLLERTLDRHPEWIRVVRLFRGEVAVEGDEKGWAILGGIPQLADYSEYADIGVIGFCGNREKCTLYPPLSCYRCPFFRAVPQDKPHRRQLAQLKAEIRAGQGSESDRMVSIFERDAAAVVDLVARISERRGSVGRSLDRIANMPVRRRA